MYKGIPYSPTSCVRMVLISLSPLSLASIPLRVAARSPAPLLSLSGGSAGRSRGERGCPALLYIVPTTSVGELPVVRSRATVILGKIWYSLLRFLLLLRWQEWVGGVSYPGISMNEPSVLQICSVAVLLLLLLVGCEDEGEECSEPVGGAEGWRGVSSALVRWRGAKRSSMKPSATRPGWKTAEFNSVTGPLDKRRCYLLQGHCVDSALLVGRGGEGEELGSLVALEVR